MEDARLVLQHRPGRSHNVTREAPNNLMFVCKPRHGLLIVACAFRHEPELLGSDATIQHPDHSFFVVVVVFLGVRSHQKSDAQMSRRRVASHVLIRRNSIRTIIRCSRSHVNHSEAS